MKREREDVEGKKWEIVGASAAIQKKVEYKRREKNKT